MCEETHFEYDVCRHSPPRSARTVKCSRARRGVGCFTHHVKSRLQSRECPQCIRKFELAFSTRHNAHQINHTTKSDTGNGGHHIPMFKSTNAASDHHTGLNRTYPESELDPSSAPPSTQTWSRGHRRARKDPLESFEWEVPSRCFINVGFERLDPWAADRLKIRLQSELDNTGKAGSSTFENKENIYPTPAARKRSFPGLRQKFHDFRAMDVFSPGTGFRGWRAAPRVKYHVELGPCCEKKRFSRETCAGVRKVGLGEARSTDDWCTSSF